jgi:hypothetical protein
MINKEVRLALLECHNAREVARRFNIPVHQVYYYAKVRHIQLQSIGRPKVHSYDEFKLIPKIKRALGKKGELKKLSDKLSIPYHILTNISKKLKKDI